ncbi:hypothetical protein [Spirochaeta dissipatitropha]
MNSKKLIFSALLIGMAAMQLTAAEARPVGRETAADGARQSLEGSLSYQDAEWFLESGSELYQLLMGRYRHEKDLALTDGAQAVVDGFVHRNTIAPISIQSGGETMEFWGENRMPLWAGAGQRKNAVQSDSDEFQRGRGPMQTQTNTQTQAMRRPMAPQAERQIERRSAQQPAPAAAGRMRSRR